MKRLLLLINLLVCFSANAQTWNSIDFDVLSTACPIANGTEIYLSEIYDCQNGGYAVVELYNPTNNPVTLTGTYQLKKYAIPGTSFLTANLIGTIQPQSTFILTAGDSDSNSNDCLCPGITVGQQLNSSMGFNAQDKIELLKSTNVIDTWIEVNSVVGYSYTRKANAVAPKVAHVPADWSYSNQGNNTVGCSEIGSHIPLTITSVERNDNTMCAIPTSVRVLVEGGSGQYERSVNGGAFVNHISPWSFNIATGGTITVIIRNKLEPECFETISFYIDPNPNPTITPIQTNI